MFIPSVHKELGVPLLYSSDTYASDVPYYVPSPLALDGEPDEGLLMIPYSLVNNDWRFMAKGNGTGCANDWFELLVADFETLYAEGLAGQPKVGFFSFQVLTFISLPNSSPHSSMRGTDDDYRHALSSSGQTWPNRRSQALHGVHQGEGGSMGLHEE